MKLTRKQVLNVVRFQKKVIRRIEGDLIQLKIIANDLLAFHRKTRRK